MSYNGFTNIQTFLAMQMIKGDRGLNADCLSAAATFDEDEATELIRDQLIARFDFGHSSHEFAQVWGTFVDWQQVLLYLRWNDEYRMKDNPWRGSEEDE